MLSKPVFLSTIFSVSLGFDCRNLNRGYFCGCLLFSHESTTSVGVYIIIHYGSSFFNLQQKWPAPAILVRLSFWVLRSPHNYFPRALTVIAVWMGRLIFPNLGSKYCAQIPDSVRFLPVTYNFRIPPLHIEKPGSSPCASSLHSGLWKHTRMDQQGVRLMF